jgi:uncharacterized membrane protein YagU involved in acid resistance
MSVSKIILAALAGGVTAGLVDIGYATLLFQVSPERVMQAIAAGVLGKAAREGGMAAAALGLGCQLLIGVVAAAIFATVATRLSVLVKRPIIAGLAFGVGIYLAMHYVIVPLSNAPHGGHSPTLIRVLDFAANPLFGLIIALWTARIFRGTGQAVRAPSGSAAQASLR